MNTAAMPFPLGVTMVEGGINVAVMSRHAERIFFCAFDASDETEHSRIALPHRLGDVHYGFIAGVGQWTHYGFRAEGPWEPARGHRFDESKLLLDPYTLAIDKSFQHHASLMARGVDTAKLVPKGIVQDVPALAKPLPTHRPQFIYEIPVRAFTRLHSKIAPERRGTVAALGEPVIIEHLARLGVDTVELMPLTAWIDERHLGPHGLTNAWGYNPVSFMAPDPRLAPGGLQEVRTAVDALHAAGIRVILDVVFNHTGESDEHGTTLSLRGLDNALYYRHTNEGQLANDTGCGNTLALDRRPVVQLAMDAMRSWVTRTGIDGFRFDLAPVLGRTDRGFEQDAPLLSAIEQDPLLSRCIMIAEPWDIGPGGYQLGGFPARWQEWNDRYRDDVRRFWRGDAGAAGDLATRISGSSDIYGQYRRPSSSINYIAAHDGFSLRDTVTYLVKNNHANGEENRDGNSHEPTWPGGDVRALLATLFLSRGTPMLTAGDEFGRSQRGNNNAYAQDNETTWLNWDAADTALIEFTASLYRLRKNYPTICKDKFLTGTKSDGSQDLDAIWLASDGGPMNWRDTDTSVLGLVLEDQGRRIALWFNRGNRAIEPSLPRREGHRWVREFCSADGEYLPPHAVSLFVEEHIRTAGVTDDVLRKLALEAGVESDWWEVDGTHHDVSPETLRIMLDALRLPHSTNGDAAMSRQLLQSRAAPIIGVSSTQIGIAGPSDRRRRFHVSGEDGTMFAVNVRPGEDARLELASGHYDVWEDEALEQKRHLIVSPGVCYVPEDIANGARVFGLASHLYALRHAHDGGIGDFETLKRFAEMTETIGGRYAGLNPLHHLFPSDRSRVSPYQPSDRRFIDPIYISIGQLLGEYDLPGAKAKANTKRAAFAKLEQSQIIDYRAIWVSKNAILEAAYAELKNDPALDTFVALGGDRLLRHGSFEASLAGEQVTPERVRYRAFLQWIAEQQLANAATHENLYRDLALGCAFDGGEITEAPELFSHGVSLGAPPDPFSREGQVWNLPPYSPLAMAAQNYRPMRDILTANMRHAAALRIDHILGFARQFWVPRGAEGRFGAYIRFPMDALVAVAAIESQRSRCLVVGEDLGTIPDGLRERLSAAQIFSYKVLWFEREGPGFKPPSSYPRHALACLASHDLPTFMGWRAARDLDIEAELGRITPEDAARRKIDRASEVDELDRLIGAEGVSAESANVAAHGFVASVPSQVMLIQADDLAGELEPLNVPGTDRERPNWRRRLRVNVDEFPALPLAKSIIARVKAERGG